MFAQEKIAFVHGKIYTVDNKRPLAQAVVIKGDTIVFVGSDEQARKLIDQTTRLIDLKGRLMLPGFIDAHVHLIYAGMYLNGLNLRLAKSKAEFRKILQNYLAKHDRGWITGGYWDHENWLKKRLPRKEWIDDITPDIPVFVERFDEHMGLANSFALKLAKITADTESPEGGLIVKDKETGEPTGILKDNAMQLLFSLIPPPSCERIYRGALQALAQTREFGITGVCDIVYPGALDIYRKLENEGKLTCRIYAITSIADYGDLVKKCVRAGHKNGNITLGAVKGFADGSLGSSSAWFFDSYCQSPANFGLATEDVISGDLRRWALDADKHGLQIAVHAIGDRANAYMLDTYELIAAKNPPWDRRFRIEHAQHIRARDIARFAKIDVIASVQPYHCIDDGVWAKKRIGEKRIKYTHPYRSFLQNQVTLCFGSDWPVAPISPCYGIYAAVTRCTLDGKNPDGWVPEQKITVEQAIRCYTINNAYATFSENRGSIEKGKLADLVVLDRDILTINPKEIKNVQVLLTVLGGKIIWTRLQ